MYVWNQVKWLCAKSLGWRHFIQWCVWCEKISWTALVLAVRPSFNPVRLSTLHKISSWSKHMQAKTNAPFSTFAVCLGRNPKHTYQRVSAIKLHETFFWVHDIKIALWDSEVRVWNEKGDGSIESFDLILILWPLTGCENKYTCRGKLNKRRSGWCAPQQWGGQLDCNGQYHKEPIYFLKSFIIIIQPCQKHSEIIGFLFIEGICAFGLCTYQADPFVYNNSHSVCRSNESVEIEVVLINDGM